MATAEALTKKIIRLKNKLNDLTKSITVKEDVRKALKPWRKKLKRTQRKKKLIEFKARHMEIKKAKKKHVEETKKPPTSEAATA